MADTAIMLTLEEAKALNKRFDNFIEIKPYPLKNGKWYIRVSTLQYLKKHIIDHVRFSNRQGLKNKAIALQNKIKDLPRGKLSDYPELQYNPKYTITENGPEPDMTDPETAEYFGRFEELDAREDVK